MWIKSGTRVPTDWLCVMPVHYKTTIVYILLHNNDFRQWQNLHVQINNVNKTIQYLLYVVRYQKNSAHCKTKHSTFLMHKHHWLQLKNDWQQELEPNVTCSREETWARNENWKVDTAHKFHQMCAWITSSQTHISKTSSTIWLTGSILTCLCHPAPLCFPSAIFLEKKPLLRLGLHSVHTDGGCRL